MATQLRPEGKARSFGENIESDLASRFLRVVEVAAIASARTMGQGERKFSDQVATEAMRRTMDTIPMRGTIVIGEGERDEAPMLYIRWKARISALPEHPGRSPCWLLPSAADCSMPPIVTWKKLWLGRRARMLSN